jgi:hypothetical protein
MSRSKKIYYVEIEDVANQDALSDAHRAVYSLGNVIKFGRGTATRPDVGWFVLYTPAESVAKMREHLALVGLGGRTRDVRDAPSFSTAMAMARQLPLLN